MPYSDPEAQRAYQARWAARKRRSGRGHMKQYVDDAKKGPCVDCGVAYPPCVMDFDHLNDKTLSISRLVRTGNLALIKAEIAKCELVCANCHRIRTWQRSLLAHPVAGH